MHTTNGKDKTEFYLLLVLKPQDLGILVYRQVSISSARAERDRADTRGYPFPSDTSNADNEPWDRSQS